MIRIFGALQLILLTGTFLFSWFLTRSLAVSVGSTAILYFWVGFVLKIGPLIDASWWKVLLLWLPAAAFNKPDFLDER